MVHSCYIYFTKLSIKWLIENLIFLEKHDFDFNNSIEFSTLQNEQIVAYTQYCLLVTLLVFVLTKLFTSKNFIYKHSKDSETKSSSTQIDNKSISTVSTEKCSIAIQTDKDFLNLSNAGHLINRQRTVSINNSVQTPISIELDDVMVHQPRRTVNQCLDFLREKKNIDDFLEEEIIELVRLKHIPLYKLETYFTDPIRGIYLRWFIHFFWKHYV